MPVKTLTMVAAILFAGPVQAQLTVTETRKFVTVTCTQGLTWKATVDGTHGGAVREFCLPADGPNLVAAVDNNPFQGFFNAFVMSRIDEGATIEERIKGKGTLWRREGNQCTVAVVRRDPTEVVVESRGTTGGWRLLGPRSEKVFSYRQTLTFRPDRVICDGDLSWRYGHSTRMVEFSSENFIAPDLVSYPAYAVRAGDSDFELPITTSKGLALPAEVRGLPTIRVNLKHGYRLDFRTLELPPQWQKPRWYQFERPWQTDWAQVVAVAADDDMGKDPFPEGKPVHYRYELIPSQLPAEQRPPVLTITSPKRDQYVP